MYSSDCVSLDEAWGVKSDSVRSEKVHFSVPETVKKTNNEKSDPPDTDMLHTSILLLLQEIKDMREEQRLNSNKMWVTVSIGIVLVLLSLSSISKILGRIEYNMKKTSWHMDTMMMMYNGKK